jgi:hypothetical protein
MTNDKPLSELLATYGTSRGNKDGPKRYLQKVLEGEGSLPSVSRTAALLGGAGYKGTSNSLSISTWAVERLRQQVLYAHTHNANQRKGNSND